MATNTEANVPTETREAEGKVREGRASMEDSKRGSRRDGADLQEDGFFLYEGGEVEMERESITRVRIGSHVKEIPINAFRGCINLAEVQFDEGSLQSIGKCGFFQCTALQQVTIPLSVTKLGLMAFNGCANLTEVHFNDGLEVIAKSAFRGCKALKQVALPASVTELGGCAFWGCSNLTFAHFSEGLENICEAAFLDCTALRSVTVPSSVTGLGRCAFSGCTNLTEVVLLGGEMLLNLRFLDRGLSSEEGALNKAKFKEMFPSGFDYGMNVFHGSNEAVGMNAFHDCPLTAIKISIPRAFSKRMARLPHECRLSVEGGIRDLRPLELAQDGTILACFPAIRGPSHRIYVEDTENQTAESLHEVLRLISFYELKESSILIELAFWKSRFEEDRARADCRISVPDPAKNLIMEYCGFTNFLEPAIEGA